MCYFLAFSPGRYLNLSRFQHPHPPYPTYTTLPPPCPCQALKNIAVSSGSACTSASLEPSYVRMPSYFGGSSLLLPCRPLAAFVDHSFFFPYIAHKLRRLTVMSISKSSQQMKLTLMVILGWGYIHRTTGAAGPGGRRRDGALLYSLRYACK